MTKRVSDLTREGLWSEKRLPKVCERPRPRTHWDSVLTGKMTLKFFHENGISAKYDLFLTKNMLVSCTLSYQTIFHVSKGQQISERIFGVFNFDYLYILIYFITLNLLLLSRPASKSMNVDWMAVLKTYPQIKTVGISIVSLFFDLTSFRGSS